MVGDASDPFWTEGLPVSLSAQSPFALPLPGMAGPALEILPLVVVALLAVLGLILGLRVVRHRRMLARLGLSALLLAVCGAVAALGVYVINGVRIGTALAADPLGGVLWFLVAGMQLALPGIAVVTLVAILRSARAGRQA